jgi:hypothetical protein
MPVVIKDLIPAKRELPFGTGVLSVRGLRLDEVVELLSEHRDTIAPFFTGEQVEFGALLAASPKIVAKVIAMASDTVGQEEDIQNIPPPDQIDVLLAIWEISVPNVSKLAEAVLRLTRDMKASVDVPSVGPKP